MSTKIWQNTIKRKAASTDESSNEKEPGKKPKHKCRCIDFTDQVTKTKKRLLDMLIMSV